MSLNLAFKALADPTRRKIITLLKEQDLSAGEIAQNFAISKPSISQHLNILKQADLISAQRAGQKIIYSLNTTVLQEITKWVFDIFEN